MIDEDRAAVEARIRAAAVAERWTDAATIGLTAYGDEILGYLAAVLRSETDAGEAFSRFAEDLWQGLRKFRFECSFRTWAYGLARHAIARVRRDPYRRRAVELDLAVGAVVAELRSRTATFLRTAARDEIAQLRASLDPDDQTLLVLRVDRNLPWRDIARVMSPDGDAATAAALDKLAAALRKRFERVKLDLKARARDQRS